MFERFRKKEEDSRLPDEREWQRIGYLMVTVHRKDDRLHFSVKARGDFEQFEEDRVVAEILRMKEWLREETRNNPDVSFHEHIRKKGTP